MEVRTTAGRLAATCPCRVRPLGAPGRQLADGRVGNNDVGVRWCHATRYSRPARLIYSRRSLRIDPLRNDVGGDKTGLGGFGIALLFADGVRYDGSYKDADGPITDLAFLTAWPKENPSPTFATRSSKDDDIARCTLIPTDEIALYDFDYLDTLEVMN